jgi:hypothetical protein
MVAFVFAEEMTNRQSEVTAKSGIGWSSLTGGPVIVAQ